MEIAFLLVRFLLACTFILSGISKLTNQAGFRQTVSDFGAPARLARSLALAIPAAELIAASLLLWRRSAAWGGAAALCLLLIFSAAIAFNLALGRTPECRCFGQLHSSPASWASAARNLGFAGCALFVVLADRRAGNGLIGIAGSGAVPETFLTALGVALVSLMAVGGWAIFHLLLQHGRLLERIDALELRLNSATPSPGKLSELNAASLPLGSVAPPFEAVALAGGKVTLDELRQFAKPVLLIFSDVNCEPCQGLLPHIAEWQREHADVLTIAVVSRGSPKDHQERFGVDGPTHAGLGHVLIQREWEIAEAYKVRVTPSGVLISADGLIASGLAIGPQAIADLISSATVRQLSEPSMLSRSGIQNGRSRVPVSQPVPTVGQLAPAIRLPDLDGRLIDLADFSGRSTVVILWNPACGFCKLMLPEILAWERTKQTDAPALLVISTGLSDPSRDLGFRSTLVLDKGLYAGRALGLSGTPSAVLIDADGRIASSVARGATQVFSLVASSVSLATASQSSGRAD